MKRTKLIIGLVILLISAAAGTREEEASQTVPDPYVGKWVWSKTFKITSDNGQPMEAKRSYTFNIVKEGNTYHGKAHWSSFETLLLQKSPRWHCTNLQTQEKILDFEFTGTVQKDIVIIGKGYNVVHNHCYLDNIPHPPTVSGGKMKRFGDTLKVAFDWSNGKQNSFTCTRQ